MIFQREKGCIIIIMGMSMNIQPIILFKSFQHIYIFFSLENVCSRDVQVASLSYRLKCIGDFHVSVLKALAVLTRKAVQLPSYKILLYFIYFIMTIYCSICIYFIE